MTFLLVFVYYLEQKSPCGVTYLGIRCQDVQSRDLQVELSPLGELADAGAQRDQVLPGHVGGPPHDGLTARTGDRYTHGDLSIVGQAAAVGRCCLL